MKTQKRSKESGQPDVQRALNQAVSQLCRRLDLAETSGEPLPVPELISAIHVLKGMSEDSRLEKMIDNLKEFVLDLMKQTPGKREQPASTAEQPPAA